MRATSRRHLRALGLAAGVVMALAGLNLVVDPYDLRAPDAFLKLPLRSRQSIPRSEYWHKAYALAYHRPETVYFGNSRVSIGMPANEELWKSKTYNCGLTAAQPEEMLAYLRHALFVGGVKRVVLAFDAVDFLGPHIEPPMFDASVLLTSPNTRMRPVFLSPIFFSPGMLCDSLKTLVRQVGNNVVTYREGVHDEDAMRAEIKGDSEDASERILTVARHQLSYFAALDPQDDGIRVKVAREMAALCRKQGVEVVVVFLPYHPAINELIEADGLRERIQNVQDQVRTVFEEAHLPLLTVHDFSQDQSHALDSQLEKEGSKVWKWWWEVSHFRAVFGHEIVEQMAGPPSHPAKWDSALAHHATKAGPQPQ